MRQDQPRARNAFVACGAIILLLLGVTCLRPEAVAQTYQPLRPYSLAIDNGTKTATATAGAATLSKNAGVITSEALTTIAGATYVLTLTNTTVAVTDQVLASVSFGTSTTGTPAVTTVKPNAGSVVITIQNVASAAVFNGTLKIAFVVIKN